MSWWPITATQQATLARPRWTRGSKCASQTSTLRVPRWRCLSSVRSNQQRGVCEALLGGLARQSRLRGCKRERGARVWRHSLCLPRGARRNGVSSCQRRNSKGPCKPLVRMIKGHLVSCALCAKESNPLDSPGCHNSLIASKISDTKLVWWREAK